MYKKTDRTLYSQYKKIYTKIESLLRKEVYPCDDGKPELIEHILELQNEVSKQKYDRARQKKNKKG